MKWYQIKEQAAGERRLLFTWEIYKIFGKKAVKLIAFLVTLFAFPGAKEARRCSKRFFEIIGLKPSLKNQFRHFLEYSYALVDGIEVFSGNYDYHRIIFDNIEDKKMLDNDISSKGAFLICSHLGNINVMRALLNKEDVRVNIFLAAEQCKVFKNFIERIKVEMPVTTYPVEEVSINTSIEIKDKLARGEIVFMAGDRTSKNSTNTEVEIFGHRAEFPVGTFRFAELMGSPVYFVCALREGENYRIYLKKFQCSAKEKSVITTQMQEEFVSFLEEHTRIAPLQFFNFYDMFDK